MNFLKKAVTTLGGIFLAALLIAALAPKATHGLVAALVQVANTTSSPVPVTDIKDQNPYQDSEFITQSSANCPAGARCIVNFKTVPAGYRLVITSASAAYQLTAGGTNAYVQLSSLPSGAFQLLPPPADIGLNFRLVSSPLTFYVEAGDTPQMLMNGPVVVDPTVGAEGIIVGYLVPVS